MLPRNWCGPRYWLTTPMRPRSTSWHRCSAGLPTKIASIAGSCSITTWRFRLMRRIRLFNCRVSFGSTLSAQPGQKLAELVRIVDSEIRRLKEEGPTRTEVARAQNERERSTINALETLSGKAEVFCRDTAATGDPLRSLTALERVFAVSPLDVQRVARQYLGPCRIEVDVVPGALAPKGKKRRRGPPKKPLRSIPCRGRSTTISTARPCPHWTRLLDSPPPHSARRKLSNGLELRIIERHGVPLVTLELIVRSGETSTPSGKEGLCSITASLVDEGTTSRSALQIAGELADIGGSLSVGGFLEAINVEMTTLTRHLDQGLDLFADVIMNPSFPEKELQRLKLERQAEIEGGWSMPTILSDRVFDRLIYPREHLTRGPTWERFDRFDRSCGTTRSIFTERPLCRETRSW